MGVMGQALNASKASPVQSAQFFEYKVVALPGEGDGERVRVRLRAARAPSLPTATRRCRGTPLDKYFYLESDENRLVVEPFSANMYLAEDRIMGFEMLVKKDCNYTLHFGGCAGRG